MANENQPHEWPDPTQTFLTPAEMKQAQENIKQYNIWDRAGQIAIDVLRLRQRAEYLGKRPEDVVADDDNSHR